ncbi:DGQHR domain-containing protein [Neobacillus niacini]|uniref:DGQHR domain-containing protein n=1 Tax=Neobacillus niacini TaxID=86668 RepID=UPI002787ED6F|nr:DGQHR domain-containing protein [Neobacillus niacini]MDQ1002691.1 DGQHR domain-containing protein [Neobacillus niacini]
MHLIAHLSVQGNQKILNTTLNLRTIYQNSETLIYGENPYGYQRPLDIKHTNNIAEKALTIIEGEAIFPTSIILGIDEDTVKDKIEKIHLDHGISPHELVEVYLAEGLVNFRIIDGQHRIAGLAKAAEIDHLLWELPLNTTILVIPNNKRVIELDVFEDINSTAKKLKTDLVLLARQQYVLLGERDLEGKDELETYIAIKASYLLNEKMDKSVWKNAIKFEKGINNQVGIIGIAPFSKAIIPLVRKALTGITDYRLEILDSLAQKLAEDINNAWEIVKSKWDDCFGKEFIYINDEEYEIMYKSNYYIQKTTGVNAITKILYEVDNIDIFARVILESKLTSNDWIKGGKMAGLTSGSGFKKAIELIKSKSESTAESTPSEE